MSDRQHCLCCSHPVSSAGVYQTLYEMDFERGIWSAAMNGDLERVKYLVQKGTDPNLRDSAGYTALHYGSRSGHLSVCKFLLENGACASPQTPGGATPLHRSAYCGHLNVAAEGGHEEVCQLLDEHCPALRSQMNKRLQLPYQLAQQGDLQELLKPPC
ncbi:ankyrin repeat domain-containing protein 39 isoform X2 [Simochromis diagramma]|uniref:ankyrin repeat domain-containing protein 39 isoform X2 n=1 Tax=Simochromis diagramma TaxID=43689 RepID=UPI001A7E3AD3|nr:ankyrin repeat domain-containing protein 39 isoform X2 [Simochromis diagramma]